MAGSTFRWLFPRGHTQQQQVDLFLETQQPLVVRLEVQLQLARMPTGSSVQNVPNGGDNVLVQAVAPVVQVEHFANGSRQWPRVERCVFWFGGALGFR